MGVECIWKKEKKSNVLNVQSQWDSAKNVLELDSLGGENAACSAKAID